VPASLDALSERWPHLSEIFHHHWDTPLPAYARKLWDPPPAGTVDPLLTAAVHRESLRVTGSDAAAEAILRRRVAPTAHHVTPTNGPGFLAADWIASAGSDEMVVVLAWSGVALSNTAWSGCLSFTGPVLRPGSPTARRAAQARADRQRDAGDTEERVWLFPARFRDALLYRRPTHPRLSDVLADLTPAVAACLPDPAGAEDFPTWALRACAAIQRAVLGRALVYLDANRIVADYMLAALAQADHPMAALMADPTARPWPRGSWLYARRKHKVVPLYPTEGGFSGRKVSVASSAVAAGLASGALCPGLLPSFVALACVNPLRCLGSFNQAHYLAGIRAAAGLPAEAGPTLIAGRATDTAGREVYPLDLLAAGEQMRSPEAVRMGELWAQLLR